MQKLRALLILYTFFLLNFIKDANKSRIYCRYIFHYISILYHYIFNYIIHTGICIILIMNKHIIKRGENVCMRIHV